MEIDGVQIRAIAPDGRVTLAQAGARHRQRRRQRGAAAGRRRGHERRRHRRSRCVMRGEFLHAFFVTERVKSHLPVVVQTAGTRDARRRHWTTTTRRAGSTCKGRCARVMAPQGAGARRRRAMSGAAGLHHRRVERHRPGAGRALRAGRLAAGAGGAAHRRGRGLGAGAGAGGRSRGGLRCRRGGDRQHRRRRRRLHRTPGPARRGDRQRRHQRGHGHRRARRPRRHARHLRHQQHRPGRHLPPVPAPHARSAARARWWASPASAAIRGLPGHGAYCASKAGVVAYCESLRGECRRHGRARW